MNAHINEQITELQSPKASETVNASAPDTQTQKSLKIKWSIIAAIAMVILAAAIGLGIYNTPANRLQRHLDLGQKYLMEQNYEEAILAFNEAIAIDDRCISAYVGGLDALLKLGDSEAAKEFYVKAIDIIDSLDDTFTSENKYEIISILLQADAVYMPDYEVILPIYDRIIEIDDGILNCIKKYEVLLTEYLAILMEEGNYTRIKELAEKYKDLVPGVDFQSYLDKIAEFERITAQKHAFMKKVYDLMKAEDYIAMQELDVSDEAKVFVEEMESDSYVYIPDDRTAQSGIGCGVYKYIDSDDEPDFYFYYGKYENGLRSGSGKAFSNIENLGYYLFSGEWANNAPNGYGETVTSYAHMEDSSTPYSAITESYYINGLAHGYVTYIVTSNGHEYDLSFSARNGIPTEDKTNEFLTSVNRPEVTEGRYVIAYDTSYNYWVKQELDFDGTWGLFEFDN